MPPPTPEENPHVADTEFLGCWEFDFTGALQSFTLPDTDPDYYMWIEGEARGGAGAQHPDCVSGPFQSFVKFGSEDPTEQGSAIVLPPYALPPPLTWVQIGEDGAGLNGGWPDGGDGGNGVGSGSHGYGGGGSTAWYFVNGDTITFFTDAPGTGGGSGGPATPWSDHYNRSRAVPGGHRQYTDTVDPVTGDHSYPYAYAEGWDGIDYAVWPIDYHGQGGLGVDDDHSFNGGRRAYKGGGEDGETPTEVAHTRTCRGGDGGDAYTWDDYVDNTAPGDPYSYPTDSYLGGIEHDGLFDGVGGGGGGGGALGGGGGGGASAGFLDGQGQFHWITLPLYPDVGNPPPDPPSVKIYYHWGGGGDGIGGLGPTWPGPLSGREHGWPLKVADHGHLKVCVWQVLPAQPSGWRLGYLGVGTGA